MRRLPLPADVTMVGQSAHRCDIFAIITEAGELQIVLPHVIITMGQAERVQLGLLIAEAERLA